jgi:hypothetical protein
MLAIHKLPLCKGSKVGLHLHLIIKRGSRSGKERGAKTGSAEGGTKKGPDDKDAKPSA